MFFEGKTVLVTGGTGSMGSTLVKRILGGERGCPRKLIVFSRDEAKQHDMRMNYLNRTVGTDETIYSNFARVLEFRIGDVRDYGDVCSAVRDADIVISAAALKQVPTCEYFPEQAVLTNCTGAANIVRAIRDNSYPVQTVMGISTDKAAKPVNVMGMTKAIQERIFTTANIVAPSCRFVCVRYGNVLASRGSVIPLFLKQIECGGPLTLTSPDMTRFLLSLDAAVDTVFAAFERALPGEIFVPKIPSANIKVLVEELLAGRDLKIQVTGIRPGEKIHEILVSEEEGPRTVDLGDYYAMGPMLPELAPERPGLERLGGEYNSRDAVMDRADTKAFLAANGFAWNG